MSSFHGFAAKNENIESADSGCGCQTPCDWSWLLTQLSGLFFFKYSVDLIAYDRIVPEGERHDPAIKRNLEALAAELKMWEGYLKVALQEASCC